MIVAEIRAEIEAELVCVERDIASLRLVRERTTYKLEQALRERTPVPTPILAG